MAVKVELLAFACCVLRGRRFKEDFALRAARITCAGVSHAEQLVRWSSGQDAGLLKAAVSGEQFAPTLQQTSRGRLVVGPNP